MEDEEQITIDILGFHGSKGYVLLKRQITDRRQVTINALEWPEDCGLVLVGKNKDRTRVSSN
jgi:hypothetical protein